MKTERTSRFSRQAFDDDDNGYLNGEELTNAAEAWGCGESDSSDAELDDDGSDDSNDDEDSSEFEDDATSEESPEDESVSEESDGEDAEV